MRRREFIIGGAAAAWPLVAKAQQGERMRRLGFLLSQPFDNEEAKQRLGAMRDGLQKLGWTEGRNLVIEARYASGSADRMQAFAAELVKAEPDVLFASATSSLAALHKATQTIPIVFAQVTDPVGAGFVKSLARPGGNITGFTQHDFSIGVKWLELLKELSAKTDRVAVIYDPQNPATAGYLSAIKAAEQQIQVRLSEHPVRDTAEIEHAIGTVANSTEQWSRHTARTGAVDPSCYAYCVGEQAFASGRLSISLLDGCGGISILRHRQHRAAQAGRLLSRPHL